MSTEPEWTLECSQPDCTFRPAKDQEMQVVADHYAEKHPEMEYALNLVILCPVDGASLISSGEEGKVEGTYSCPTCMNDYSLLKNPLEN